MKIPLENSIEIYDTLVEIKKQFWDFIVTDSYALSLWNYDLPHASEDLDILVPANKILEVGEIFKGSTPTKYGGFKWSSSNGVNVDFIVSHNFHRELESSSRVFIIDINISHPLDILQNKIYCAFISQNSKLDHINELCYLLENNKDLICDDKK